MGMSRPKESPSARETIDLSVALRLKYQKPYTF